MNGMNCETKDWTLGEGWAHPCLIFLSACQLCLLRPYLLIGSSLAAEALGRSHVELCLGEAAGAVLLSPLGHLVEARDST
jgi:hypothetical protein